MAHDWVQTTFFHLKIAIEWNPYLQTHHSVAKEKPYSYSMAWCGVEEIPCSFLFENRVALNHPQVDHHVPCNRHLETHHRQTLILVKLGYP